MVRPRGTLHATTFKKLAKQLPKKKIQTSVNTRKVTAWSWIQKSSTFENPDGAELNLNNTGVSNGTTIMISRSRTTTSQTNHFHGSRLMFMIDWQSAWPQHSRGFRHLVPEELRFYESRHTLGHCQYVCIGKSRQFWILQLQKRLV